MGRRKQLQLALKLFNVRLEYYHLDEVQAASADAAKYRLFKALREAGYFRERDGFRDFLRRSPVAMQLRR